MQSLEIAGITEWISMRGGKLASSGCKESSWEDCVPRSLLDKVCGRVSKLEDVIEDETKIHIINGLIKKLCPLTQLAQKIKEQNKSTQTTPLPGMHGLNHIQHCLRARDEITVVYDVRGRAAKLCIWVHEAANNAARALQNKDVTCIK